MKQWQELDRAGSADGTELTLKKHDTEFLILSDGRPLMSSRTHGSEDALATLGCEHARNEPRPAVLVGGLGMGFTVRAALDVLPAAATVVVAEMVPAVVDWNRGPLAPLAGCPLDDPRVRVEVGDANDILGAGPGRFDAVLLDVDNGPAAFTRPGNATLYGAEGLGRLRRALKPGGVLAIWSASDDPRFTERLRRARFEARAERVRGHGRRGARHVIFVGRRR